MQPRNSNRRIAGVAIVLLLAFCLVLGLVTPRRQSDLQRRPSTFFTDSSGARGLFEVLRALLGDVRTWRRPLTDLPAVSADHPPGTLLVAGPGRPLSPAEASRLVSWIEAGGQLLLFSEDGWAVEGNRSARTGSGAGQSRNDTLLARLGTGLHVTRGVEPVKVDLPRINPTTAGAPPVRVRVQGTPAWSGVYRALATSGQFAAAIEVRRQAGRVVVVADPGFVSNESLRHADNAVWILDACAGRPGPVYIDEYHHGFGEPRSQAALAWAFARTPWGWCTIQLAVAAGLYWFGCRRRLGRPIEPPAPGVSPATDPVAARAGLFRTARSRRLAADLMIGELAITVTGRPLPPGETVAEFCRQQRVLGLGNDNTALFDTLERLYGQTGEARADADCALVDLGRVVSRIQRARNEQHHDS